MIDLQSRLELCNGRLLRIDVLPRNGVLVPQRLIPSKVNPRVGQLSLIAGQLAMGAVIDRFGLFGLDPIPIGWARGLGIVLLAVGAALSLRK